MSKKYNDQFRAKSDLHQLNWKEIIDWLNIETYFRNWFCCCFPWQNYRLENDTTTHKRVDHFPDDPCVCYFIFCFIGVCVCVLCVYDRVCCKGVLNYYLNKTRKNVFKRYLRLNTLNFISLSVLPFLYFCLCFAISNEFIDRFENQN